MSNTKLSNRLSEMGLTANAGRLKFDPRNPVYVKVAQAAQAAADIERTARPSDDVATVQAAVAKRDRKAMSNAKLRRLTGLIGLLR